MSLFKRDRTPKMVNSILVAHNPAGIHYATIAKVVHELVALGPGAVDPLRQFLSESGRPKVRRSSFAAAALALYELGDKHGLDTLFCYLDVYGGYKDLDGIAEVLSGHGPDVVPRLREVLAGSGEKSAKAAAISILAGLRGAEPVKLLQEVLLPPKPYAIDAVLRLAKQAEAQMLQEEAADLIVQLLEAYVGQSKVMDALIPLAVQLGQQFDDTRVVVCLCDALDYHLETLVPKGRRYWDTGLMWTPSKALKGIESLWRRGDPASDRIAASLIRALVLGNKDFRRTVEKLLRVIGPPAVPLLEEAVANPAATWPYAIEGGDASIWDNPAHYSEPKLTGSAQIMSLPLEAARTILRELRGGQ